MTVAAAQAADTFVVSCIDPRFVEEPSQIFQSLGRTGRYSEMRIAGAALAAVNTAQPAWSTALWENLAASRQLHGVRRVTFLNHRDCGAVKAWAGRSMTPAEEMEVHADLLNRAAAEVRRRHPDMEVEIALMALDGSVQVLPCAQCAPAQGLRAEAVGGPRDPEGFAELVRLRTAEGTMPDEAQERALLAIGVREHRLTAEEARQIRARHGGNGGRTAERDVAAYLATRSDRQRRIGSADVRAGAQLYRRLSGGTLREQEARARTVRIASGAGLEPRAEGFWPFRSRRWFNRQLA